MANCLPTIHPPWWQFQKERPPVSVNMATAMAESSVIQNYADRIAARRLLSRYLAETSDRRAEECLEELLHRHLHTVLTRTIRRLLQTSARRDFPYYDPESDAERVYEAAQTGLVVYLTGLRGAMRGNERPKSPEDILAYAASATHHAYHALLNKKHPRRLQFKRDVQYVLERDPQRFALWKEAAYWCSLERWRDQSRQESARWVRMRQSPAEAVRDIPQALAPELNAALWHVLDWLGHPALFEPFVSALATARGVVEATRLEARQDASEEVEDPLDRTAGGDTPEQAWERKYLLRALLESIGRLERRRRVVLLFGLKDLDAFVECGAATLRELANVLEMPFAEFHRLWSDPELNDETIAASLGITANNARFLRNDARAKLAKDASLQRHLEMQKGTVAHG